jgi:Dullard-like phosphatase family protein
LFSKDRVHKPKLAAIVPSEPETEAPPTPKAQPERQEEPHSHGFSTAPQPEKRPSRERKDVPSIPSSSSSKGNRGPALVAELQQVRQGQELNDKEEPPQLSEQVGPNIGRKTLVLDLDETLVHSSFRTVRNADIIITVEIEGESHQVYVRKRPGCDEFLLRVAQLYEVVIYTASMVKYANPLLDKLDPNNVCSFRLYREACTRLSVGYVKDLSRLGRDLRHVIIIDNSPTCYALQPDNAIPIRTWRDDMSDRELFDLIPILYSLADVEDIPQVLRQIIWTAEEEDGDKREKAGSK